MPAIETLSLISLTLGTALILRFVWVDSIRFREIAAESSDPAVVSLPTARRLARQAEAARIQSETEGLPRAA